MDEYDPFAATGWLASSCGADGTTVSYAYSNGGEVTGVVSVAGTTRYALDKAGRRTRIDSPAGTFGLGYCAWKGKLAVVTNAHGLVAAYAYDVMDRVTNIAWRTVDGTFLGGFSYEYDAAGRIVSRNHSLGGESYYPLTDIQGSVWGYVDSANNVVARWTYDVWGNVLAENVTVPSLASLRYRFQGREWSSVTSLINFRFRWYDSNTGRWLSKDPIGLSGGLNLYVLVGNSPINSVDPTGLAHIKTRPLDAGEDATIKNRLSSIVSYINLPGDVDPRHREIFFDDGLDTSDCPGHIGYGPTGVHKDTSKIPYNNIEVDFYVDSIMRRAVKDVMLKPEWSGANYNVVRHNCQDFVSAVIKRYRELSAIGR